MAKKLKLTAQTRTGLGRSAVKKLKQQGFVPAVVYGGKEQPISLQLNAREITTLLARATSDHFLVDLEITDGEHKGSRLALIQEVQHHVLRRDVLHVDFHAVRADEVIHAEIPVETLGEPIGVKSYGGILELAMHSVEVECLPKDLPDAISLDVSALNVGDAIHIKDLVLPTGVKARADGELTVIRVAAPKVEVEPTPEAAAAAQPEVLKEKKEGAAAPAAGAEKKPADKK